MSDFVRCYEYNKCGREKTCIGAMYDEKCWTRAGSYADPPVFICMLLEKKLVDNCTACSYFRLMKRIKELMDLAGELKKSVSRTRHE